MGDSSYQLSIKGTETILEQMKFSVCKILNVENKGTGFFCNIPLENKFIKVLITNNHVIGDKDLFEGNSIKLSLNDDKIQIKIVLRSSRKMFTNKELDITFIEIIEEDLLKYINFLEIDEMIYIDEDFINEYYCKKQIYTLHYPKAECLNVSYGIFKEKKQEEIYHYCNTEEGSSGGPILSLKSLKVIGIHKACSKSLKINIGIFIKYAINLFIQFLKKQRQNNKALSILKKNNKKIIQKSAKIPTKQIESKKYGLNNIKINLNNYKFSQISPSNKSGNIKNKSIISSNNKSFIETHKTRKEYSIGKNNKIYHKKSFTKLKINHTPNIKNKKKNNNNLNNYKEEFLIDKDNDIRYSLKNNYKYSNFNNFNSNFNYDLMNDKNDIHFKNYNNNLKKYNANFKKENNNYYNYQSNYNNNVNKYLYNNNMNNNNMNIYNYDDIFMITYS